MLMSCEYLDEAMFISTCRSFVGHEQFLKTCNNWKHKQYKLKKKKTVEDKNIAKPVLWML